MKSLRFITSILLLAAAGCVQEIEQPDPAVNPETGDGGADGTVTLTAVIDDDLTRTVLDGQNYVCWSDGDEVWINGSTYTVSVSGNTASIPGVTAAAHYACVYPADAVDNNDATSFTDGHNVKITLPGEQTITYNGSGQQILTLPMAAYGDGTTALQFKNLCGLMAVSISNTDLDDGIKVTEIVLSTSLPTTSEEEEDEDAEDYSPAPLWGKTTTSRDLSSGNINSAWAVLASNIESSESESVDKSTVIFTLENAPSIAKGSSRMFYVPVPVLDDNTKSYLSMIINGTLNGMDFISFENTTGTKKVIGRNQVGAVPVFSTQFRRVSGSNTLSGSGTEDDPYLIRNAQDFNEFSYNIRHAINNRAYYLQTADIDFDGAQIEPAGFRGRLLLHSFSTISNPFRGVYDGDGHKLTNFVLNQGRGTQYTARNQNWALFPYILGGTLKNLSVEADVTVIPSLRKAGYLPSEFNLGGIVGTAEDAVLSDLSYSGTVSLSEPDMTHNTGMGGIAGKCVGTSIINCSVSSSSEIVINKQMEYVGGLFGLVQSCPKIQNCSFAGKISNASGVTTIAVGGICGNLELEDYAVVSGLETIAGSAITISELNAKESADWAFGGIAGVFSCESTIGTLSSTNRASISVTTAGEDAKSLSVGGVFGRLSAELGTRNMEMENTGSITVNDTKYCPNVGGVAGYVSNTSGKYTMNNTGNVTVTAEKKYLYGGGLIGLMNDDKGDVNFDFISGSNSGNVTLTDNYSNYIYAGGMIGYMEDSILGLNQFTNSGAVSAKGKGIVYAGGVSGNANPINTNPTDRSYSYISEITNSGDVYAESADNYVYAGGLFGYFYGGYGDYRFDTIKNSGKVKGVAKASEGYVGGFTGLIGNSGYVTVINEFRGTSQIAAETYSYSYVGGILGYVKDYTYNSTIEVFNSQNTGEIFGESKTTDMYLGGFFGYHNSDGGTYCPCIINCCNRGGITGRTDSSGGDFCVGGFMGYTCNSDTEVGASFSMSKMDLVGHDRFYVGGLSGTWGGLPTENNAFWWTVDTNYVPNLSGPGGTKAWNHTHNGVDVGASKAELISTLNAAQSNTPRNNMYTKPTYLTWTNDSDGFPVLKFND